MDISSVIACLILCNQGLVLCDEGINHHVSYQGFGDLVLTCNGSDVINITKVDLKNHPTVCNQDTCTLSANDIVSIEHCNDNSTCTIPVQNMSGCIAEKGFYNVRYSCREKAEVHKGAAEQERERNSANIGLVAGAVSAVLIVCLAVVVLFIVCSHKRKEKDQTTMHNQVVLSHSTIQGTSSQTQPAGRESMSPLSHYTDINQSKSAPEHKYMTISTAFETIDEPSNDYMNNPYSSQLCDNYTTLDSTRIENPNVYDDLASPSYTNMNTI